MRIDKFLANSGVGTRSNVRLLIKSGVVSVNDKFIKSPDYNVVENEDNIKVNGKNILYRPFVYIMLNKPKGYLSATNDKKMKTVVDLLNNDFSTYKVFPIGRLDIDTEGLLILTNDGDLSHNLLSPKKHVKKKYYVETQKEITNYQIESIQNGVNIGDYITKDDAYIELINKNSCYLTITEGKFHQVKKMFQAVSNEVIYLKRVMMNNLYLDETLKVGEYKELTNEEFSLLKGEL
ncbi:pseudouridine synthase [Caviibacter abscessus]|uniref:pseudouridine synthase n=1 Tax=Caviibacter abscessus TaxID=1766719 RepID=UPI0008379FBF|nr:pseudouridine synthase [Caviibacter abscessus]